MEEVYYIIVIALLLGILAIVFAGSVRRAVRCIRIPLRSNRENGWKFRDITLPQYVQDEKRRRRDDTDVKVFFFPDGQFPCVSVYGRLMDLNEQCSTVGCKCIHDKRDSAFMGLLEALSSATESLHVCNYLISEERIAELMAHLHDKKKVDVKFLTDTGASERCKINNQARQIKESGIEVKTMEPVNNALMHLKFAVIDKKKVVHGSMNWTQGGILQNHECVVIETRPEIVEKFVQRFDFLWTNSRVWDN